MILFQAVRSSMKFDQERYNQGVLDMFKSEGGHKLLLLDFRQKKEHLMAAFKDRKVGMALEGYKSWDKKERMNLNGNLLELAKDPEFMAAVGPGISESMAAPKTVKLGSLKGETHEQKMLKAVPVIISKEEGMAKVRQHLSRLKAGWKSKGMTEAGFEKLVLDAFEQFYYDSVKGAGNVHEKKPTPEARRIAHEEYGSLKTENERLDFLLKGTEMYLSHGIPRAREQIMKQGRTGFVG